MRYNFEGRSAGRVEGGGHREGEINQRDVGASKKSSVATTRKLRPRSYARNSRRGRTTIIVPRPRRCSRWEPPPCQALPQLPRCRRHALLSLASGLEVAELELLQTSPLAAVTAPWLGPAQAELPIAWYAGVVAEETESLQPSRRLRGRVSGPSLRGNSAWGRYLHAVACRFRAVFLSPRFDPLPPCREVQSALAKLVRQLARFGLQIWVQTRGVMLAEFREALRLCKAQVRVTVALATLDRELSRALEPGAAPPALRLSQLQWLLEEGISTQVTIAPLVPELTDTPENLLPVLSALRTMGWRRATFGYLLLDPLADWQHPSLVPAHWGKSLAELYEAGSLRQYEVQTWARCLAQRERQRRYARLLTWATELGFELRPSNLADPDFRSPLMSRACQAALLWPD
ncbi:MAG: hypothetical protein RMJ19_08860 [Gemmatales bacterium]|nr:hypothetical protein [Gemmatales bacterium]MDW8175769.1 hypothetical protein [Gemmatales bacterium]